MANDFRNYRDEAFQNKENFKEYFDYFAHIYYGKELSETGMIENTSFWQKWFGPICWKTGGKQNIS